MTIVTARIIERLSGLAGTVPMNELARDTWQAMSLAERSVVCNPHSDKIYLTKTDPIDQMVEDALRATGQMGITHRYKRALTNVLTPLSRTVKCRRLNLTPAYGRYIRQKQSTNI